MLGHFEELRAHNRLWSRYLSINFAVYIIDTCYSAYCFLTVARQPGGDSPYSKLFFAVLFADFAGLLLWVTTECTAIVRLNGRIYASQKRFYELLDAIVPLPTSVRLRMNALADARRAYSCAGFSLADGMRINSKMFQVVS